MSTLFHILNELIRSVGMFIRSLSLFKHNRFVNITNLFNYQYIWSSYSSNQNDEQIHAEIDKFFHLVSTSLLALKFICCVVVILFDMAMFVSIIRQSLCRQRNARNGNGIMFVIGIFFLSFSYSLVILLTILELVYFETFPCWNTFANLSSLLSRKLK